MRFSISLLNTVVLKVSNSCLRIMYLLNLAQIMLVNMGRRTWGMNICQVAWVLLSALSTLWLISHCGSVVYNVSSWACTTMPVVATVLYMAILLQAGSRLAQYLFHAAWERMAAEYPPATFTGTSGC